MEITQLCHGLKVGIYHHFGAIGSKMSSLEQLCSLLPFNPWNWFNLGQMCLQLLENKGGLDLISVSSNTHIIS